MTGVNPVAVTVAWGAVVVVALLAVLTWRRRPPPQLWPGLFLFYVAAMVYCVGANMAALVATTLEARYVWLTVMFAGIMNIPPLLWLVVLGCAAWLGHRVRWAGRLARYGPFLIPVIFWPVRLTNPWHGLFSQPGLEDGDRFLPVWYVYLGLAYVVMLASIMTLIWLRWRTRRTPQAGHATLLLIALLIPWLTNVLAMSGVLTIETPNPTVIAICATGVLMAGGIYRQRLFALSRVTLQRLIDQDADAVVTLDEQGRLHYANGAAHGLLGADMLQPGATPLTELAPRLSAEDTPDDPYTPDTLMAQLQESPPTAHGHLFHFAHDRCEWLRIAAITARDPRGRLQGYSLRMEDVTEQVRREREEQELRARRQEGQRLESLGMMASGIAHDFNNLLVGVLGNAELLLMDADADAPRQEHLAQIREAAERAAALTAQMLAYSGRGFLSTAPIDLAQLVQRMRTLLPTLVPPRTMVEYVLDAVPRVTGDAAQLHQVVSAMCVNAGEALDDGGGTVTIRTGTCDLTPTDLPSLIPNDGAAPGPYAFVEVRDTGCGMDADTVTRIFDPFFSTKFTGRGLGLAAVHGIVRAHEGVIRVTSTPGEGTTVALFFPVAEAAATPRRTCAGPATEWRGSGTVLVVDDEEHIRDIASSFLEQMGFTVLTACDGREGVACFADHAADITAVLLDFTMPHMMGDAVYAELRRRAPELPITIMSGYTANDIPIEFAQDTHARFLAKPFRAQALTDTLRELLN